MKKLELKTLDMDLAVCRLDSRDKIPDWAIGAEGFVSISRTEKELSIVCPLELVPKGILAERDWKAFRVEGQLDFGLTGILYSIAKPMAENFISIFAVSTYDTDYVLIKEKDFERALNILSQDFIIKRN